MPCHLSVGISSCLPRCYPSISFSVDLCCISQKLTLSDFAHYVAVFSSSSSQALLFSRKCQHVLRVPPSWCHYFSCGPLAPLIIIITAELLPSTSFIIFLLSSQAPLLVNSDPRYLKDVSVGSSASTLIQQSSQWLLFHLLG